jgi:hypothetical protein
MISGSGPEQRVQADAGTAANGRGPTIVILNSIDVCYQSCANDALAQIKAFVSHGVNLVCYRGPQIYPANGENHVEIQQISKAT